MFQIPFPWQITQWQQLLRAKSKNRLPQGLILSGQQGVGKNLFAKAFAKGLLCQSHLESACNECKACNLFEKESHPNLLLLMPEQEGKQIKVDQIRQAIDFMMQTSQRQGHKIVMISPAEAMNRAAGNALLKILEEPPESESIFILVSHQYTLLPATVLSRCQRVVIGPPSMSEGLDWINQYYPDMKDPDFYLKISHNAPLAALKRSQEGFAEQIKPLFSDLDSLIKKEGDPIRLAKQWATIDKSLLFQMLQLWSVTQIHKSYAINPHEEVTLIEPNGVAERTNLQIIPLFKLFDTVSENIKFNFSKLNLNQQLSLESIFQMVTRL